MAQRRRRAIRNIFRLLGRPNRYIHLGMTRRWGLYGMAFTLVAAGLFFVLQATECGSTGRKPEEFSAPTPISAFARGTPQITVSHEIVGNAIRFRLEFLNLFSPTLNVQLAGIRDMTASPAVLDGFSQRLIPPIDTEYDVAVYIASPSGKDGAMEFVITTSPDFIGERWFNLIVGDGAGTLFAEPQRVTLPQLETADALGQATLMMHWADQTLVAPGSISVFSLTISNPTENTLNSAVLQFVPLDGYHYIRASGELIRTDRERMELPDTWIETGIDLGHLKPGDSITLRYELQVSDDAPTESHIWVQPGLYFDGELGAEAPVWALVGERSVTANVQTHRSGRDLQFSARVVNNGTIRLDNVRVYMKAPEGATLVRDATTATYQELTSPIEVTDAWLFDGVNLGHISAGADVELAFTLRRDVDWVAGADAGNFQFTADETPWYEWRVGAEVAHPLID